jgi:hypothetical protein
MITVTLLAGLLAVQSAPDPQADARSEDSAEQASSEIEVVEERQQASAPITDRSHPDFVRCRTEAVIGSRARRKRTCMTNREWALIERRGNASARDIVGDNQPGFLEPPGG